MPKDAKKSQTREKFVLELMEKPTLQAACKACGISREAGRLWLKEPETVALFNELRTQTIDQGVARLVNRLGLAVATTVEIMESKDAGLYTKGYAAKTVIDASVAVFKQSTLESRLLTLEDRARELGKNI